MKDETVMWRFALPDKRVVELCFEGGKVRPKDIDCLISYIRIARGILREGEAQLPEPWCTAAVGWPR